MYTVTFVNFGLLASAALAAVLPGAPQGSVHGRKTLTSPAIFERASNAIDQSCATERYNAFIQCRDGGAAFDSRDEEANKILSACRSRPQPATEGEKISQGQALEDRFCKSITKNPQEEETCSRQYRQCVSEELKKKNEQKDAFQSIEKCVREAFGAGEPEHNPNPAAPESTTSSATTTEDAKFQTCNGNFAGHIPGINCRP